MLFKISRAQWQHRRAYTSFSLERLMELTELTVELVHCALQSHGVMRGVLQHAWSTRNEAYTARLEER